MSDVLRGYIRGVNWDPLREQELPDCRLRGPGRRRTTVRLGMMMMERVYCANCGSDGGLVTAEWTPHIFYICDECARKCGPPPNVVEVSAETVGAVKAA